MLLEREEFLSFLYGTLLGDSFIHNGSFSCKQISEDLMLFKKKIIEENLPNAKISFKRVEAEVRKGVKHQAYYEMWVSGDPLFKELEKVFYPNGKKIVPKGMIEKLTPLGLAMLYADDGTTILVQAPGDGSSAKNRRVQICTDCFSVEEHKNVIQKEFLAKGYETTLVKRKTDGSVVRLQFPLKYGQKLLEEIAFYFYTYFPSLLYKIDLGYRGESLDKKTVTPSYKELFIKISAHPLFKDRCIKDDIV